MEKDVIPAAGFDYIGLDMKIPGGSLINKANSFVSIVKAYYKCREIVKDYDEEKAYQEELLEEYGYLKGY